MPFDDATELSVRLDRIKRLTEQLNRTQSDSADALKLAEAIQKEATAARELLKSIQHG